MAPHVWNLVKDTGGKNNGQAIVEEQCKFCYTIRFGPLSEYGAHWFYCYYAPYADLNSKHTKEIYPPPECIKLPIKLEALERCSDQLRERYKFAQEWVWSLYWYGENDFFFKYFYPGIVPEIPRAAGTNRRDLYAKMAKWVEDAFIAQYKIEAYEEESKTNRIST